MKKGIIFLSLFVLCFIFINCSNPTSVETDDYSSVDVEIAQYPKLKIVSHYSGCIYRVGIVGYSFDDIQILNNESKTFELVNGMPSGYKDVDVSLSFGLDKHHEAEISPLVIKCDFQDGKTTKVTLSEGGVSASYQVSYY